ncbi:unnamed protein product [Protopolystoma xenopodis]|uniref:Uncharacterized protein n=1 Tax=Protopolystoma xenopodis TaxID=117903 RepID=A0A448WDR3_9PLAT|nr:unnamed protein product [Protopolystoma xenopodis]
MIACSDNIRQVAAFTGIEGDHLENSANKKVPVRPNGSWSRGICCRLLVGSTLNTEWGSFHVVAFEGLPRVHLWFSSSLACLRLECLTCLSEWKELLAILACYATVSAHEMPLPNAGRAAKKRKAVLFFASTSYKHGVPVGCRDEETKKIDGV